MIATTFLWQIGGLVFPTSFKFMREFLISARQRLFKTQRAAAIAAGIDAGRYSRMELGYCDIRAEDAQRLAPVLQVSVEELLGGKPTPPRQEAPKVKEVPRADVVAEKRTTMNEPPIDDLKFPKSFALKPPVELLAVATPEMAKRLRDQLVFAEKVLHTTRVPAAAWVAWRDFSRAGQEALRGNREQKTPAPVVVVATPRDNAPVAEKAVAPQQTTKDPRSRRQRGHKNFAGYFADVAKERLTPTMLSKLNEQAAAQKKQAPEVGFMRHFTNAARDSLTKEVFSGIEEEAIRRASSAAA